MSGLSGRDGGETMRSSRPCPSSVGRESGVI